jgi:putative endonuclease
MASDYKGTLYIGVTSDLIGRVYKHKEKFHPKAFTSKYDINRLVYFEQHATYETAIPREKQLKRWRREWKIELIEEGNPGWRDLYNDIQLL